MYDVRVGGYLIRYFLDRSHLFSITGFDFSPLGLVSSSSPSILPVLAPFWHWLNHPVCFLSLVVLFIKLHYRAQIIEL